MRTLEAGKYCLGVLACCTFGTAIGWAGEPVGQKEIRVVNLAEIDTAAIVAKEPPSGVRRPGRSLETEGAPPPVFFEDFQGGVMPMGWLTIDNDGLPVSPNVAQFTDAWIVAEDFDNPGDFVAMSTSWYQPPGVSDDWLITPDIAIGQHMELAWRAEAQDPGFPDGYNVHVSTTGQSIAGCQANPTLFSIPAENGGVWTDRSASLAAYDGQIVNICFQNNSNDQFVLMIDDVVVDTVPGYDAAITAVDPMSEYARVPLPYGSGYLAVVGGTVANLGTIDVTNVVLTGHIIEGGAPAGDVPVGAIPLLSPGESQPLNISGFFGFLGDYSVELEVTIDEPDDFPLNNLAMTPYNLLVTADQLGRDDDVTTGTLGIGDGTEGELGTGFAIPENSFLEAAVFRVGPYTPPVDPGDPDIVGNTTHVTLWEVVGGMPGMLLAETEAYTFVDYDQHTLTLAFPTPVFVPAGDFVLTVFEEDENIILNTATNVFTPGTTWVDFPGNPFGGWAHNEDYGFNVTYVLRAVVTKPTLSITKDGSGTGTVVSDPAGLDCGVTCEAVFPALESVLLTPIPDMGSVFAGWSGDPDCSDGDVIMDADLNCIATFDLNTVNPVLHVTKSGTGFGGITSIPAGIDCGATCSSSFDPGTVVHLEATPDPGSIFTGWTGDPDCYDGQVGIFFDLTCNASFDLGIFADGFESHDVGAWSTSAGAAPDDHGNNAANATVVSLSWVILGNIESGGDADWFSFDSLAAGLDLVFETTLTGLPDSTLTLYDSDGVTVLAFDDDGGVGLASMIAWTAPTTGTYYLEVKAFGPDQTGTYSLRGNIVP